MTDDDLYLWQEVQSCCQLPMSQTPLQRHFARFDIFFHFTSRGYLIWVPPFTIRRNSFADVMFSSSLLLPAWMSLSSSTIVFHLRYPFPYSTFTLVVRFYRAINSSSMLLSCFLTSNSSRETRWSSPNKTRDLCSAIGHMIYTIYTERHKKSW